METEPQRCLAGIMALRWRRPSRAPHMLGLCVLGIMSESHDKPSPVEIERFKLGVSRQQLQYLGRQGESQPRAWEWSGPRITAAGDCLPARPAVARPRAERYRYSPFKFLPGRDCWINATSDIARFNLANAAARAIPNAAMPSKGKACLLRNTRRT